MDYSVEDVIAQISKIETDVSGMSNMTEAKKMVMSEQMSERIREYDRQLFEDTHQKINEIEDELEKLKEEEIARAIAESEERLVSIQHEYEEKHDIWVDEIVQSIVRK